MDDTDEYKVSLLHSLHSASNTACQYNQKVQCRMKEQYEPAATSSLIRVRERVLHQREPVTAGHTRKFHIPWTSFFRVIEIKSPNAITVSCIALSSKPLQMYLNQLIKCITAA